MPFTITLHPTPVLESKASISKATCDIGALASLVPGAVRNATTRPLTVVIEMEMLVVTKEVFDALAKTDRTMEMISLDPPAKP
jgi:hypothetical protein